MEFTNYPFNHIIIDDFLNDSEYEKAVKIYNSLQFIEKKSDLFHIFQTNEQNQNEDLMFFTDKILKTIQEIELNKKKKEKEPEKTKIEEHATGKYWFNTFASYYRDGSYLLCHDDKLENRKYAFSYYLEDFSSGELVLYNSTANKEVSRLIVKKNRIVIFEVCDISFHEVAICTSDGRKAFTGWYNHETIPEHQALKFEQKKYNLELEAIVVMEKIVNDCMLMEIKGYDFNYFEKELVGPFTERKVNILNKKDLLVPLILGYSPKEANLYQFDPGHYILLRDIEKGKDIWDIFVMFSHDIRMENKEFITYIEPDGQRAFDLAFVSQSLYAVRRNLDFFVPRTDYEFLLAHFVLVKDQ